MSISEKGPSLNSESIADEASKAVESVNELAQELTPEEQIKSVDLKIEDGRGQMSKLLEGELSEEEEMSRARQELGLPPIKEDAQHNKEKTDDLLQQKSLEQEKARLEKERLIEEERQKILQEIVNELFSEFESFSDADKSSIMASGFTSEGSRFGATSRGDLSPENAIALAKAFNEGIKMLPQILSAIPEMVKAFNDALTDEATRRVEEKMLKNNEGKDEESLKEDDKEANNMSKEAETVKEEGVSASAPESGIENGQAGGIKTE